MEMPVSQFPNHAASGWFGWLYTCWVRKQQDVVFVDFTVTLQVNTADNNEITETTENSEESSKKVSEDGRLGNRLSD